MVLTTGMISKHNVSLILGKSCNLSQRSNDIPFPSLQKFLFLFFNLGSNFGIPHRNTELAWFLYVLFNAVIFNVQILIIQIVQL